MEENEMQQGSACPEQVREIPAENEMGEEVREDSPMDLQVFDAHIENLQQQERDLQQQFPDFSLSQELLNPVFLQLTAPGTGISVEDAYYALHRRELQETAAKTVRQQLVSAISSGARRPVEAGTSSQGPSLLTFRYDSATKEQREAFKKELRRAWGRGETVYPR